MMRSFKYRLHPSRSQERLLDQYRRQCCALYNAALEHRITCYRRQGKSITNYDQNVQLTDLRRSDPAWSIVPVEVHRSALRRLDRAYQAFFRRLKNGDKPGFPRFRAVHRYDSFEIGRVSLNNDRVRVPKIGLVKLNLYRPIEGTIRNATIRRDAVGKWWISFQCDVGEAPQKAPIKRVLDEDAIIGIDLGLTTLATLSTGEEIQNHRFTKRSADKLKKRQQSLARKKKGSKSRERAKALVAKAHAHVTNQRLDHCRKEAKKLVAKCDAIAHEDLNLRALSRGKLAKSFHDAACGLFLRCIASKAEEAGKHDVPVDHRQTSQLCICGRRVEKTLSERMHRCVCGLTIGRDHCSALIVKARGRRALELLMFSSVEGEAS
jgi:putative transposase